MAESPRRGQVSPPRKANLSRVDIKENDALRAMIQMRELQMTSDCLAGAGTYSAPKPETKSKVTEVAE